MSACSRSRISAGPAGTAAVGAAPWRSDTAARSVRVAEMPRASTAAVMAEAGEPRSSASMADQRPVPFWPALSTITSTTGLPVAGSVARSACSVISTR